MNVIGQLFGSDQRSLVNLAAAVLAGNQPLIDLILDSTSAGYLTFIRMLSMPLPAGFLKNRG